MGTDTYDVKNLSADEIGRLFHKLQVNQIELERQNNQLRKAQFDLEESRTRYTELYDHAPVGCITLDQNYRITEINLTGASLFGLERNQMIGHDFVSFVQSDFTDTFIVHCRTARETQSKQTCELKLHHPRSIGFDAQLETVAFAHSDDGLLWYRTTFSDITDRKEAEAALIAINDQLAKELAATKRLQEMSAHLIQGGDIQGLYEQIVAAAVDIMHSDMASMQMLDHERGALRLLAYHGFDPAFGKSFAWVDIDTNTSCGVALRRGHRTIVPDIETFEGIAGTSSCEAMRAVGIRAMHSTPLFSRAGNMQGMITTHWRRPHEPTERDLGRLDILARQAADLIERAQSEAAMLEFKQRLNLAVQRAPLLLYHQNASLVYTWMHDTYPGLMMEQILGKTDGDMFPPDEALQLNLLKQSVIETGSGVRKVVQHTLRDQVYFYDLSIEPLKNAAGGVVALTCAAVDVTARRRDEEIIKQHNEEMEDFLYIIAHDLKSPVVSLQGLLGVMREDNGPALDQEGLKMLNFCIEECARMKNIVMQVREMGRIKQTSVVQEKANLQSFIHSVVQRFDNEINAKKVQIAVDCPDVEITFAKVQVDQALNNLIDNALKYGSSSPTPMLTIQGQVERTVSRIRVTDKGSGIAPVHHQQVFKLFRRLNPQGPVNGSGVGLTSVQSLMRRINGEVNLKSDVNQGAQLTISFPSQTAK